MKLKLNVKINKQPDYTTCGPTSLHAIYTYYKDIISLPDTISEINQFDQGGGTLGVVLGTHALKRGYKVKLISYNINIFDPTWFGEHAEVIRSFLEQCLKIKSFSEKHSFALKQYIEYLDFGGELSFCDLSSQLLRSILDAKVPILTGLSSTWLYHEQRENPVTNEYDPIHGEPAGHFVVIDGYNDKNRFSICDPYHKNPINSSHHYLIGGNRLINAILLGISSYDGNLLIIEKKS